VEAREHYYPILLHIEEYSVREAPQSRTATAAVHGRKLQKMLSDRLNRGLNRQGETLTKRWTNVVIPCPRFQ
jgi:hypothetical protein